MILDLAIPHCNHLKVFLRICVSVHVWKHFQLFYFSKTVLLIGNDLADEEVDIGGNEPPVSSYPHGKAEKDIVGNEPPVSSDPNVKVENDICVNDPPVSSDPYVKVENDICVNDPPVSSDPDVKVEIDAGGSVPPVLNILDVKVEKDATCRMNNCPIPDHSKGTSCIL